LFKVGTIFNVFGMIRNIPRNRIPSLPILLLVDTYYMSTSVGYLEFVSYG
jgi:hypothetical protein